MGRWSILERVPCWCPCQAGSAGSRLPAHSAQLLPEPTTDTNSGGLDLALCYLILLPLPFSVLHQLEVPRCFWNAAVSQQCPPAGDRVPRYKLSQPISRLSPSTPSLSSLTLLSQFGHLTPGPRSLSPSFQHPAEVHAVGAQPPLPPQGSMMRGENCQTPLELVSLVYYC